MERGGLSGCRRWVKETKPTGSKLGGGGGGLEKR
jgi:hypothetical protein